MLLWRVPGARDLPRPRIRLGRRGGSRRSCGVHPQRECGPSAAIRGELGNTTCSRPGGGSAPSAPPTVGHGPELRLVPGGCAGRVPLVPGSSLRTCVHVTDLSEHSENRVFV